MICFYNNGEFFRITKSAIAGVSVKRDINMNQVNKEFHLYFSLVYNPSQDVFILMKLKHE